MTVQARWLCLLLALDQSSPICKLYVFYSLFWCPLSQFLLFSVVFTFVFFIFFIYLFFLFIYLFFFIFIFFNFFYFLIFLFFYIYFFYFFILSLFFMVHSNALISLATTVIDLLGLLCACRLPPLLYVWLLFVAYSLICLGMGCLDRWCHFMGGCLPSSMCCCVYLFSHPSYLRPFFPLLLFCRVCIILFIYRPMFECCEVNVSGSAPQVLA